MHAAAHTVIRERHLLCFGLRKATKESLVESSSSITESLMSISRMMAEQVKQSEDSIGVLGKSANHFLHSVSSLDIHLE